MNKHPLYNYSGLQKNNKPQVLYALVNKKAELEGLRIEAQKRVARIESEIQTISDSIKIFDPDLEVQVKPKPPLPAKPSYITMTRVKEALLKVLKKHKVFIHRDMLYEESANLLDIDMRVGKIRQKFKNVAAQSINIFHNQGVVIKKEGETRLDAMFCYRAKEEL